MSKKENNFRCFCCKAKLIELLDEEGLPTGAYENSITTTINPGEESTFHGLEITLTICDSCMDNRTHKIIFNTK